MLRNGGTATVIGMIPLGQKMELHGFDFLCEKRIQGSNMGSNRFRVDMPRYIDIYLTASCTSTTWSRAGSSWRRSTRASPT